MDLALKNDSIQIVRHVCREFGLDPTLFEAMDPPLVRDPVSTMLPQPDQHYVAQFRKNPQEVLRIGAGVWQDDLALWACREVQRGQITRAYGVASVFEYARSAIASKRAIRVEKAEWFKPTRSQPPYTWLSVSAGFRSGVEVNDPPSSMTVRRVDPNFVVEILPRNGIVNDPPGPHTFFPHGVIVRNRQRVRDIFHTLTQGEEMTVRYFGAPVRVDSARGFDGLFSFLSKGIEGLRVELPRDSKGVLRWGLAMFQGGGHPFGKAGAAPLGLLLFFMSAAFLIGFSSDA